MKYGFVIDNRKCIGCHACTVACKSEHDVPVGVNRTWVKQVEKGTFPDTRRVFSVMRCNHCSDAPCVDICPTQALFTRDDGIVDFDARRCIGCKGCMQACPYDALYIDPETSTAAKCNYCAHRVDIGLEPACVNVCPEHAIISGDMENPATEIAQLISTQQVTVRKAEKGTQPNVFYIDGDEASLNPSVTERSDNYIWSSQSNGVGHFSKYAEKLVKDVDLMEMAKEMNGIKNRSTVTSYTTNAPDQPVKSVQALMQSAKAKRVYDTPDKGILWGWEVSTYVWTKAISAGAVMVAFVAWILGFDGVTSLVVGPAIGLGLFFLAATGVLLVMDLDQPSRFLYVLLRPQWSSWLTKGGYAITVFGGLLTLLAVSNWMDWTLVYEVSFWGAGLCAFVVAIYTAFLFGQAKGRDFWQSPALSLHMIIHSLMAGGAILSIWNVISPVGPDLMFHFYMTMMVGIFLNLLVLFIELYSTHPTESSKRVVGMIVSGQYKQLFWGGTVLLGNIVPFALLWFVDGALAQLAASVLVLAGIYITEHIWVEAPQRLPLS